jgi:flagellar motor switch protein FliG
VGEFILSTISKRMADQLREDAVEREKPTEDEIENATGAIVSVIRQMEESGDLTLTIPDEAPPQVG